MFSLKRLLKPQWYRPSVIEIGDSAIIFSADNDRFRPILIHGPTAVVLIVHRDARNMTETGLRLIALEEFAKIHHSSREYQIQIGEYDSGDLWEELYRTSMVDEVFQYGDHHYRRTSCTTKDTSGKALMYPSFKRIR